MDPLTIFGVVSGIGIIATALSALRGEDTRERTIQDIEHIRNQSKATLQANSQQYRATVDRQTDPYRRR